MYKQGSFQECTRLDFKMKINEIHYIKKFKKEYHAIFS